MTHHDAILDPVIMMSHQWNKVGFCITDIRWLIMTHQCMLNTENTDWNTEICWSRNMYKIKKPPPPIGRGLILRKTEHNKAALNKFHVFCQKKIQKVRYSVLLSEMENQCSKFKLEFQFRSFDPLGECISVKPYTVYKFHRFTYQKGAHSYRYFLQPMRTLNFYVKHWK